MPENMPKPSMLPAPNHFQYAPSCRVGGKFWWSGRWGRHIANYRSLYAFTHQTRWSHPRTTVCDQTFIMRLAEIDVVVHVDDGSIGVEESIKPWW